MRDTFVLTKSKQEECVVLLRSINGYHILTAPLDMSDVEQLDMLCAAQDIVTQRIALANTPPPEPEEPRDESTNT